MIGHEKALHEMIQLKPLLTKLVFSELLKAGKINFTDLNNEYVKWLEGKKTEKEAMISHLSLHLGLCAGQDKSPFSRDGRKFLYDNGLYTGKDGSIFGKQLEDEFGNITKEQS